MYTSGFHLEILSSVTETIYLIDAINLCCKCQTMITLKRTLDSTSKCLFGEFTIASNGQPICTDRFVSKMDGRWFGLMVMNS